jgi:hypothetical protein
MSIREKLGASIHSTDLSMSPTEEHAIDRVAAMARVSELGGAVLRLKYGLDAGSYVPVRSALVRKAKKKAPRADPAIVDRLAARVLYEFVDDRCEHCHGRQWVQRGARRQQCRSCNGTGERVPRDADRAAALGLTVEIYLRHWHARLERMLAVLRSADSAAVSRLRFELEQRSVRATTTSRTPQSVSPLSPLDQNNMGVRQQGIARPEESESPHADSAAGFVVSAPRSPSSISDPVDAHASRVPPDDP